MELAWNLGHVVAYCLWTYLLVKYWRPLARLSFGYQWICTMLFAVFFGLIIEMIQKEYLGRMADLNDVLKNMIGCGFAMVFFAPTRFAIGAKKLLLFKITAILIVMEESLPLGLALTDELIAREQFPALGTFETPFEITRWAGNNSRISIDDRIKSRGKASLRIDLDTDGYSGADLKYFPRDWRDYSSLNFMVFNARPVAKKMVCRVNDFDHIRNGYHNDDRFSQRIRIQPGWNQIEISLKQIENAPLHRKMNLSEIEGFAIFFYNLDQSQSIYLDDVKLKF